MDFFLLVVHHLIKYLAVLSNCFENFYVVTLKFENNI